MKNDINLLTVRKSTIGSDKKRSYFLFATLFVVVIIAAVMLPGRARSEAEEKNKALQDALSNYTITEESFEETTKTAALCVNRRSQLEALYGSRSDILLYLSVIENSLPQTAVLTLIEFSDNLVGLSGFAQNDGAVAAFCLKLRQSDMFSDVFITSSTRLEETNSFSITASLHKSLSGNATVEEDEKKSSPVSPSSDNSVNKEDKQ